MPKIVSRRNKIVVLTFATFALAGCAYPPKTNANPTSPLLTTPDQLVTPVASPQSKFAKSNPAFYTRLVVRDLRTDQGTGKCVDQSIASWIRKVFSKSSKSIVFTATITDPTGNTPLTLPLYASSKDETTSPPICSTVAFGTSQTGFPITSFYVADYNSPFKLSISLKVSETTNVSAATSTIAIAGNVLSYTNANGALLTKLSSNPITQAATAIDSSLSDNYSSTNTISNNLTINPFPQLAGNQTTDAEWDNFKDGIQFGAPEIEGRVWGVKVGDGIKPNFEIIPQNVRSLMVDNSGKYLPATQILGEKLLPSGQGALRDKLLVGIGGFNTKASLQITDPTILDEFCTNSLSLFQSFLTYDDSLVAQFALLNESTAFFKSSALRNATRCLPQDQQDRLSNLSGTYKVPSLEPAIASGRNKTVTARTDAIARALKSAKNRTALLAAIYNPSTFILAYAPDITSAFPARPDGKPLGVFIGTDALDQLAAANISRLKCGRASPGQSLKTIVAILNTSTSTTPVAAVMTFSNPDPPDASSKDSEPPTLRGLSFYSVETAMALTSVTFKKKDDNGQSVSDCDLLDD